MIRSIWGLNIFTSNTPSSLLNVIDAVPLWLSAPQFFWPSIIRISIFLNINYPYLDFFEHRLSGGEVKIKIEITKKFSIFQTTHILIFRIRQAFWEFRKPFSMLGRNWERLKWVALSTRIYPYKYYFTQVTGVGSRKTRGQLETNKYWRIFFFIKIRLDRTLKKAFESVIS